MSSVIHVQEVLRGVADLVERNLPYILQKRYEIIWKPDGSPVTAADVWIEDQIAAFLHNQIPGIQFIGEETYALQSLDKQDWIAVLDPIDGTENFCSGLKEWGVSLSIWNRGVHAGSMLMLPEMKELMTTGAIPRVPRSRIVGFSSSYHPDIGAGMQENPESRVMGCAVYNLFNVIRGSFCRFVNPKGAYSWDLLAGIALAHEAGCIVKIEGQDYNGQFLEPNKRYRVDIQHRYDFHSGEGTLC